MAVYSASEDFVHRTLAAVPGVWPKLEYMRTLRGANRRYEHWGMQRTFGTRATQAAIEQAHRDVVLALLRTPVAQVLSDAEESAAREGVNAYEYAARLDSYGESLLPDDLGGGSARHFSSVLKAIVSLARAHKAASRRAS